LISRLCSKPADLIFQKKILLPRFVNNIHTSASIDLLFLPYLLRSSRLKKDEYLPDNWF